MWSCIQYLKRHFLRNKPNSNPKNWQEAFSIEIHDHKVFFDNTCPKIPDLKALGPVNWCPFLSCMRWRAARRAVRAGALLLVSSFPPIQFCVDSLCTHSYPRQSDHPGHPSTTGQSRTRASRAPGKHALPGFPHRRPYLRARLRSAPVEQRA